MAATKAKKPETKGTSNIIVGVYPPKGPVTLWDYIHAYGLKVADVKKVAKQIGVEPCLKGH
jgi:hypothetical protein